jgi:transposase-like protein
MSTPNSFPKTLQAAILYYADPDNCLATAIRFRWPDGVTCPHCGSEEHGFLRSRRIWKCKNRECRKQFSAKAGTIFEDSPLGLDKWFVAMWLIVNAKNEISSWELHRAIGVTQKTAWFMLHRLREALHPGGPEEPLSGEVEADETFIGGKAKNMHRKERKLRIQGRGAVGKAIVFGLLERHPENKGSKTKAHRVRVKVLTNTQKATIQPEVQAAVLPGSHLYTDSLPSYQGMVEYVHETVDHAEEYVRGSVHTNNLENFWSLLKRCINGTYVSVEAEHLGRYLDEQAYRFNERKQNDQGRFLLVGGGIAGRRLTYKELTAREEGTPPRRGG